jgi:hypothetical protein
MTEMTETNTLYPTAEPTRAVKLFANDEIRRFSFQGNSFALFSSVLESIVNVPNYSVRYQDDEGDWVTIASDYELEHAFQLAGSAALKIKLEGKNTTSVLPKVAEPLKPSMAPPTYDSVVTNSPSSEKMRRKQEKMAAKLAGKEWKRAQREEIRALKLQLKEERQGKKEWKKQDKKELAARFVKHVNVPEYYEFAPGTPFIKTWRFRNEGTAAWPLGCNLVFVSKLRGDIMSGPAAVAVPKSVLPGEEIDISVNLTAPNQCGNYAGFWRLTEPSGRKFGQRVRVLIKVVDSSSSSGSSDEDTEKIQWTKMLESLESMGFTNKVLNMKLLARTNGDMNRVITRLTKKQEKMRAKKE